MDLNNDIINAAVVWHIMSMCMTTCQIFYFNEWIQEYRKYYLEKTSAGGNHVAHFNINDDNNTNNIGGGSVDMRMSAATGSTVDDFL